MGQEGLEDTGRGVSSTTDVVRLLQKPREGVWQTDLVQESTIPGISDANGQIKNSVLVGGLQGFGSVKKGYEGDGSEATGRLYTFVLNPRSYVNQDLGFLGMTTGFTGTFSPVPEGSAWVAGLLALIGTGGVMVRRWQRRMASDKI
jgi:hypothetical protein